MKRVALGLLVGGLLLVSVRLAGNAGSNPIRTGAEANGNKFTVEARNPWTNLEFNANSNDFQFAIVSDRTGGHREKVFARAVEQLNLLQPEFVLSVGDLIEGYTKDEDQIAKEWREFQSFTAKLQMPFFYVPGNHDITNPTMAKAWQERFGRHYYHFVYKNVLFLILCSDDPPQTSSISNQQIEYARRVLAENQNVRWTIVAMHKPLWAYGTVEKNGWLKVEEALQGRNYTVFAGHVHNYRKFVRHGMNYYQLATTGGVSRLRGVRYGEFDHIVWATMKNNGPVLANVLLDGVWPEDLVKSNPDEPGFFKERKPTFPVKGKVTLDGKPAFGASIVFHLRMPDTKKLIRASEAYIEEDGSYLMTTYGNFDGSPAGEYIVTVETNPVVLNEAYRKGEPTKVPTRYSSTSTSELRATVREEVNVIDFALTSQEK
jgi:predicted phosphodiesterase